MSGYPRQPETDRTIAEVLAYDPALDPNHRHLCPRCGAVFVDTATFGLCAEMGSQWGRFVGTLPLPFLRRLCSACRTSYP